MERVRKMIIVPEDAFSHMQQQQPMNNVASDTTLHSSTTMSTSDTAGEISVQTPGDNLSRLDAEMFDILHSKKIKDVHEKCVNLRMAQPSRRLYSTSSYQTKIS